MVQLRACILEQMLRPVRSVAASKDDYNQTSETLSVSADAVPPCFVSTMRTLDMSSQNTEQILQNKVDRANIFHARTLALDSLLTDDDS